MILEACVGNLNSAILAEKYGADQIELCDRLDLDGTSPALDTIKLVRENVDIPLKVIINPNPFNYCYNDNDVQQILKYLDQLNQMDLQGIVFGPLDKWGKPDLKLLHKINTNTDLPITYHKAIDQSADLLDSLKMLKEENTVRYILSSGGKDTALRGSDLLIEMKKILRDSKIELIAAGKINDTNLHLVHNTLQLNTYHGRNIVGTL